MKTITTKSGDTITYNPEEQEEIIELMNKKEDDYSFMDSWYTPMKYGIYFYISETGRIRNGVFGDVNDIGREGTKIVDNNRVFQTKEQAELYQKIQQAKLRIERYLLKENTRNLNIFFFLRNGILEWAYLADFKKHEDDTIIGAQVFTIKEAPEQFIKEMHDDILLVMGK